jgi:hypothetical protein
MHKCIRRHLKVIGLVYYALPVALERQRTGSTSQFDIPLNAINVMKHYGRKSSMASPTCKPSKYLK